MKQRILITGATGRLGRELKMLVPEASCPTHSEMDLTSVSQVRYWIRALRPDLILHCAALTDVRRSEADHSSAWAANVTGSKKLVRACAEFCPQVYFVYVSTACVFDGNKGNYTEDDVASPKNFYGYTKLKGEFWASRLRSHLIARMNFIARDRWPYSAAFVDRFGTYLFADEAAAALLQIIEVGLTGIVHICSEQRLSMWEVARMTTPEVAKMTMDGIDIPLTRDMTLRSVRIPAFRMRREAPCHL